MSPAADPTDALLPDLAKLRTTGLDPSTIATVLDQLTVLPTLPVVTQRRTVESKLSLARAISSAVSAAADLRANETGDAQLMLMLFRLHPRTAKHSPAEARATTCEASGLQDRAFRNNRERQLLQILADALLELARGEDIRQWGRTLSAGQDAPQSIALYWLDLFRDHYFRMETAAYALQVDLTTAHAKLRTDMNDYTDYLRSAIYWNVQFSYVRDRFFKLHGPLWFSIDDAAGEQLSESAQRIEYHDAYPEDFIARLRRVYANTGASAEDLFYERLAEADLTDFVIEKADAWLRRCACPDWDDHSTACDVGLVLTYCDLFGQTVEQDFARIQAWYRTERYAADAAIGDLVRGFRLPGNERA